MYTKRKTRPRLRLLLNLVFDSSLRCPSNIKSNKENEVFWKMGKRRVRKTDFHARELAKAYHTSLAYAQERKIFCDAKFSIVLQLFV